MMTNVTSIVPFIAATKIIADHGLGVPRTALLLLFLIATTMLMVSFPVLLVITVGIPAKSQGAMESVTSFLNRHGRLVASIFFLLVAIYLIIHGINGIREA